MTAQWKVIRARKLAKKLADVEKEKEKVDAEFNDIQRRFDKAKEKSISMNVKYYDAFEAYEKAANSLAVS